MNLMQIILGKAALYLEMQGVRLIGGCCGTTPKHIEAVKKHIGHLAPITNKVVKKKKPIIIQDAKPT